MKNEPSRRDRQAQTRDSRICAIPAASHCILFAHVNEMFAWRAIVASKLLHRRNLGAFPHTFFLSSFCFTFSLGLSLPSRSLFSLPPLPP